MSAKQIERLEQCIRLLDKAREKWYGICYSHGYDGGVRDCSLCKAFNNEHCIRCPIAIKVGQPFCRNSPYDAWRNYMLATWVGCDGWIADTPERRKLAKAELNFLVAMKHRYVQKLRVLEGSERGPLI